MSSSFSISVPSTPVSSRTARAAASTADSPGSMCPLGSASTAPRFTRTAAMNGRPCMFLTTTPPAENSRSVATGALDQRDEAHGHDRLGGTVGTDAREPLAAGGAHRAHQQPIGFELLEQRRRWLPFGRGGHRDAVEGRAVRRAAAAVTGSDLHVVVAE